MSRREYFGQCADPSTRICEWCSMPAIHAFEIFKPHKRIGTAKYVYACGDHEHLALTASRAPRAAA